MSLKSKYIAVYDGDPLVTSRDRIDASHSDEGCKMLLLLHAARVHVYEHTAHRHVGIDWMNAYAHLCANKAAAASCSLHHCAMHLCVSRDMTNGLPTYTAIYFVLRCAVDVTPAS